MLGHLNDLTIAVTGLHTGDNPQPGAAIIRCLRKGGFEGKIIGLVYEILESGIYVKDLADSYFRIPYPSANEDELIERYKYISGRHRIDILIPTLDSELMTYIKLEQKLSEIGIKMYLPKEEQLHLRDKSMLFKTFTKHNIPTPKTEIIVDEQQILEIADRLSYPVFVKGNFYGADKAYRISDVIMLFKSIREKWGLPVIVQDIIEGDEYNIALLGDGSGEILGMIPQRKLIITDKGKGFGGVVIQNDKLTAFAEDIIKQLKWKGGCELEIIKAKSGAFYLLEINPRFPAWIRLSEGAGQNLPAMLVRLALGEQVEKLTEYKVGTLFVRHSEDVIADINEMGIISTVGELY